MKLTEDVILPHRAEVLGLVHRHFGGAARMSSNGSLCLNGCWFRCLRREGVGAKYESLAVVFQI
jgi:hypothetical protein